MAPESQACRDASPSSTNGSPPPVGGAERLFRPLMHFCRRRNHGSIGGSGGWGIQSSGKLAAGSFDKSQSDPEPAVGCDHVQQFFVLPLAIEQIDLSDAELVISSSHLVAKGVLTAPDQLHLVVPTLCGTPGIRCMPICSGRPWRAPGWAPDPLSAACRVSGINSVPRGWMSWWRIPLHRPPDSQGLGTRCRVLGSPVAVDRFRWDQPRDDVYLCLCRLVPYKRVDLVVEPSTAWRFLF